MSYELIYKHSVHILYKVRRCHTKITNLVISLHFMIFQIVRVISNNESE